jgi:diguanylate cyclase (GGDEF)-like protein
LDLYRDTAGELSREDLMAAQTLADVAAAYLLNAKARDDARVTLEQYRYSAFHDPLTGLPNRSMLNQRLEHAAQRSQRSQATAAILFADLDRFKDVNDTHGHQVGDELLLAVADRLKALVRPGDTLARLGGDEFVVLCEDLHTPADVEHLASRIDRAFAAPFVLTDVELSISASVGTAYAGRVSDIGEQLLTDADTAMYQAKRRGGARHQSLDVTEAQRGTDRSRLERELRAAVARDELDVAYQPIVRTVDGIITGAEALLRWSHPDRGAVSAVSMVEVAEMSDLIDEIGARVLTRGCRDRNTWRHEHPQTPLDLAVNVSVRQLMNPRFPATALTILEETGMDPNGLILEITENVLVDDHPAAVKTLAELKAHGVRIALDDFGTGYSSLSYLRRLPIDLVKIDRSFIADIDRAPAGSTLVAGITNLIHALDLTVTAEGVETHHQHDTITTIGCDTAQGFLYAPPAPATAITTSLASEPVRAVIQRSLGERPSDAEARPANRVRIKPVAQQP